MKRPNRKEYINKPYIQLIIDLEKYIDHLEDENKRIIEERKSDKYFETN